MRKITLQLLLFFSISVYAQNFTESLLVPNNTFDYPYDMVYGPDNFLYLTERVGERVQRVNVATGTVDLLLDMSALVWRNGGQDGLLGIILHPQFGQGTGNDYIYLSYTYSTTSTAANRRLRIVRYTFTANGTDGSLSSPLVLLDNLPGSNDHNSAKFAFGPDGKLYYTIGDQGKNQFDNKCLVIRSQDLPTAAMVIANDYSTYEGKILRMNLDGSIPSDNPLLGNVRSHIFTYGHRNPQGIAFSSNGILYSNEHGPKSDDEINIITAAKNYGWPRISGFKDDRAYTYCNWSTATNCTSIAFSDYTCGTGATTQTESSFNATDFQPPVATFYTVDNTFDFSGGYLTWPTIAPSSLKIYEGYSCGIPGWDKSLLSTSLKAGRIFRSKLSADGSAIEGTPQELFSSNNRLRSVVIAPNGKEFYIITDSGGSTSGPTGSGATVVNPGVILKYTYIPSDKPVATAATNILENEFQANWNAPCATPASYKLDVSTVVTFLGTESSLAEWRATTNTTTATSSSNGNNTKTISVNTGVAITYTTGVAGNAYSTSGWTSVAAKWWQIDLVTTGRYNIRVSSAQQSSNTGPRDFKLQYRIGTSGIWTDVPNATNIQCANNFTTGVLSNIVLPEICNNKAQVFLRWLVTSNTAVNGAAVVSGGTNRIDNIVILSSNQSLLANYNDLTVNGTNTQVTGLAANTTYYYRVRAVHANETSLNSEVFTVTTNPPMSSSGNSINVNCNGEDNGAAMINVTGGSPPYSYSWSPTGGTNSTATGLAAGNYIVTVTDSKLKTHTRNFTITEPFQTVWNGTSWSNGLPAAGIKAVFNANYSITSDMAACGVVVNTGATVTLNSNFDLTVDGKVQVATGGLLIVENNANLIQVRDVANTGAIQVKRQASMRRLDYVYWSSPVANQNLLAFSPLTMTNRFYTLNEVTNNFEQINPSTNTFDLAKGYMIRAPNTFPTTPQTFNGLFQGVPNNGNAAIGVTVASSGNNLIGNPYPSTVNAVSFLNDNPGTIYFWTHSQQGATAAANYASFNLSGGTAATAGGPTPNG
ncbi:glucose/sorbosone family PQQ-dependent dehydrogenase, partial [Flavobacterium sp.]|uniref:glucose/sorbosone family PQQ-dependent dehydrogenase n=1 Tax=Flavobacterium sp. TaxID=239 RepID=UPI00260D369D